MPNCINHILKFNIDAIILSLLSKVSDSITKVLRCDKFKFSFESNH